MKKNDEFEQDILDAYEKGELISAKPSKKEKEYYKVAAQATFLKGRRAVGAVYKLSIALTICK